MHLAGAFTQSNLYLSPVNYLQASLAQGHIGGNHDLDPQFQGHSHARQVP